MKPSKLATSGVIILALLGLAGTIWALAQSEQKAAAPAVTTKAVKEGDLNVITLTPEAEARLGVKTATVERREVQRQRTYGGQLVVPPGKDTLVTAPFAGVVTPSDGDLPAAGNRVERGQVLFSLTPLLTPEARLTMASAHLEAQGSVRSAQVQLEAAQVALGRAKQLVEQDAGSKRGLDEAQERYELAQQALENARTRSDYLDKALREAHEGSVGLLEIRAPQDGILAAVRVAPGQIVSSDAALVEVSNQQMLWVRVPVYVGDESGIDLKADARVGPLGRSTGEGKQSARPVVAPPAATPGSATVDLVYEVENKEGRLRPGQRVGVTLNLKGEEASLVAPWSSIVRDYNGGAWVYESLGNHSYARRRVEVRHVLNDLAVLGGINEGLVVVVEGVAEIFGREMGFAK